MNFFDQQSSRRRQSMVLLGCFVLAMLGMGALIQAVVVGMSRLLGDSSSLLQPSPPALGLIALVWLTILAGGFFRFLDVRGGGAVLARRFGAVRASDRVRFDKEQRLLNVVAEMAIASSTPQPDVFVLRSESSINAFVLGSEDSRHVLVVTQGALDAFERPELQAVIGHEFAHIANGDLPHNMRLLIALGGLMAIDEVGRLLVGDRTASSDERFTFHPGMIVGHFLRIIGSVGVFCGQLIRSAYSRQREYLADASAVQFTRNPIAMASALDIIRQHDDEPALHGLHAQELTHLCFQSGRRARWYNRLLSTHPRIQSRINVIEPHFDVKRRKLRKRGSDTHSQDLDAAMTEGSAQPMTGAQPSRASAVPLRAMGNEKIIARDVSRSVLSDRILLLLPDESSCLAALFGLFANADPARREIYFTELGKGIGLHFMRRVRQVTKLIPDELSNDQLGLIEHACDVLVKSVRTENRQRLLLKLETILNDTGECTLMNYATLQLIRRKLGIDFPLLVKVVGGHAPMAAARRVKSFDAMGSEFALLLSLMVESSGASSKVLDAEFERVLKCYTQTRYPRRTAREGGIITELEAAFQTLYAQPKPIRQAFVQHCLEIVQQDGYVARAERALVELFAASLGCDERMAA